MTRCANIVCYKVESQLRMSLDHLLLVSDYDNGRYYQRVTCELDIHSIVTSDITSLPQCKLLVRLVRLLHIQKPTSPLGHIPGEAAEMNIGLSFSASGNVMLDVRWKYCHANPTFKYLANINKIMPV